MNNEFIASINVVKKSIEIGTDINNVAKKTKKGVARSAEPIKYDSTAGTNTVNKSPVKIRELLTEVTNENNWNCELNITDAVLAASNKSSPVTDIVITAKWFKV